MTAGTLRALALPEREHARRRYTFQHQSVDDARIEQARRSMTELHARGLFGLRLELSRSGRAMKGNSLRLIEQLEKTFESAI